MRWICVLSILLLAGCQRTKEVVDPFRFPQANSSERKVRRSTQKRTAAPAAPRVVPLNEIRGRVAVVHPTLRFVVIDFYLSPLPTVDQRLGVFRQGQKVGEVKISREERNQNVAADIVAGEARVGDEVRVE